MNVNYDMKIQYIFLIKCIVMHLNTRQEIDKKQTYWQVVWRVTNKKLESY